MVDSVVAAVVYGMLGITLSFAGYRIFDLCETRIDFSQELKNGNIAVSIVVASFILGICFIIGRVIGSS